MKTRTALIIAIMLGLFTYSLPLYAGGNNEYHMEEKTVIEIPVIGKISTLTRSTLSGCKLKEATTIKMHNAFVKMMSESDGKSHHISLSDLCDEIRWSYNENEQKYISQTFQKIRAEAEHHKGGNDIQIDMESDQNDIDNLPEMTHNILGFEKNINGFNARKVVTTVYGEETSQPIIITEYFAANIKALKKISDARQKLARKLGKGDSYIDGVPSMIKSVYDGIREDRDLDRPEGEVVRLKISLLDDDQDPIFQMQYDVLDAGQIDYEPDHFELK